MFPVCADVIRSIQFSMFSLFVKEKVRAMSVILSLRLLIPVRVPLSYISMKLSLEPPLVSFSVHTAPISSTPGHGVVTSTSSLSKSCASLWPPVCLRSASNFSSLISRTMREVFWLWSSRPWRLVGLSLRVCLLLLRIYGIALTPLFRREGIVFAVFPNLNFISSMVVAACLTPTDPIISAAIVGSLSLLCCIYDADLGMTGGKFAVKHVPLNLRRVLSAESAANDGLAYPFLSLSIYLTIESSKRVAIGEWFLIGWLCTSSFSHRARGLLTVTLDQVILGTVIGAVLGEYTLLPTQAAAGILTGWQALVSPT